MNFLNKILRLYNLSENKLNDGCQISEIIELETRLKVNLPYQLRDYYLTLGKNEEINNTHNRLLKLANEVRFSSDRYLIFYIENQEVVKWGIKENDLKLDNPPVWGNYGTTESPDWHLESKRTEDFLLQMAVYNGTLGGLEFNANSFGSINSMTVSKIKNNWNKVPEISWEKQGIYTNDFEEILSLSFDGEGNCTTIFIGTNNKKRFDRILEDLSLPWSYVSYEDLE